MHASSGTGTCVTFFLCSHFHSNGQRLGGPLFTHSTINLKKDWKTVSMERVVINTNKSYISSIERNMMVFRNDIPLSGPLLKKSITAYRWSARTHDITATTCNSWLISSARISSGFEILAYLPRCNRIDLRIIGIWLQSNYCTW